MASPQAQQFFNSMPAAEQQRIRESWGGADLTDQWYTNAVNAGAVPGAQPGSAPAAAGVNPNADPYANDPAVQAGRQVNSNISDAQWAEWGRQGLFDPSRPVGQQFKSTKEGAQGQWGETPDNCPPGMQAYGLNQCVAEGSKPGTVGYGGPGGAAPAQGGGEAFFDPNNPLQAQLMQLYQERGGQFGQAQQGGQALGQGGVWWTGQGPSPAAATAAPTVGATPSSPVTGGSATTGLAARMTQPTAPSVTGIASSLASKGAGEFTPTKKPLMGAPTQVSGALTGALGRAYKDPTQWWKRQ